MDEPKKIIFIDKSDEAEEPATLSDQLPQNSWGGLPEWDTIDQDVKDKIFAFIKQVKESLIEQARTEFQLGDLRKLHVEDRALILASSLRSLLNDTLKAIQEDFGYDLEFMAKGVPYDGDDEGSGN
jgi:hypothetical protein